MLPDLGVVGAMFLGVAVGDVDGAALYHVNGMPATS